MKKMKSYKAYEDYVKHQKKKTLDPVMRKRWKTVNWKPMVKNFTNTFQRHMGCIQGKALCVCARMGHEVHALKELGIDAIGIDLVPYLPLVEEGDMHNIKYPDNTFDFVFSNSFDHSLEPEKMISEIERVLKVGGCCLLQFHLNKHDNYTETKVLEIGPVLEMFKNSEIILNKAIPPKTTPVYQWEIIMKKQ